MSVRLEISPELQPFIGNRESVKLEGETIREMLGSLAKNYPESKKWFFNKDGQPTIWVILNNEIVFAEQFDKSLSEKDDLRIIRIFGGG